LFLFGQGINIEGMETSQLSRFFRSSATIFSILLISLFLISSCKSKKIRKDNPAFTVIATAKSYRGTPYKYGGTTRSGMDCSALVFHSFYAVGINLPRMSADQSKVGKKIKIQQVSPGDLLFFATGKRRNQVTHSGIVTEVGKDIRFIHSSTSLGVTEDYLSNRYWKNAFLFATRILE
jgi:probable lipoprotein NlpC